MKKSEENKIKPTTQRSLVRIQPPLPILNSTLGPMLGNQLRSYFYETAASSIHLLSALRLRILMLVLSR